MKTLFNKNSENPYVVYSSLSFILISIFLFNINLFLGFISAFVGLASFFHHTYPKNIYFRISDWLSAVCIVLLVMRNINFQDTFLIFLICISSLLWVISFITFHKHKIKIYNITHTVWHILAGVIIYRIFI
jgi:hypothetical protein